MYDLSCPTPNRGHLYVAPDKLTFLTIRINCRKQPSKWSTTGAPVALGQVVAGPIYAAVPGESRNPSSYHKHCHLSPVKHSNTPSLPHFLALKQQKVIVMQYLEPLTLNQRLGLVEQ